MTSRNVEIYRAGHEAFNQRDFAAMTKEYADNITWTDHAQGRTFRTPQEFKDDFLPVSSAPSPPSAPTTGRSDPSPPPARSSPCRCARCGTSIPTGRSSEGTSTTTRSRCSRSWT